MITRKDWQEFKDAGLLWYINTQLHLFGWAITLSVEDGDILEAFPAKTKFRGFSEECNNRGYDNVTTYLSKNIQRLVEEATYMPNTLDQGVIVELEDKFRLGLPKKLLDKAKMSLGDEIMIKTEDYKITITTTGRECEFQSVSDDFYEKLESITTTYNQVFEELRDR